jgi:hypothetical protein
MQSALDTYIAHLLSDYDCVVVPQLGGFVTNYRPAYIDEKASIAYPPSKEVRFNRNLTRNDGLLANAMATRMGLSFEEATDAIRREVHTCLKALEGGDRISFRKIGVLYFDEHRSLRFEPDRSHNFYRGAFGMQPFPVVLHKAQPQSAVAQAAPLQEPAPIAAPTEKATPAAPIIPMAAAPQQVSSQSRAMYWVAAATLLPFLGLSLYMGISTRFKSPTELTFADLNPLGESRAWSTHARTRAIYQPRSEARDMAADPMPDTTAFPEASVFSFSFTHNSPDSTGVWVRLDHMPVAPASAPATRATATPGGYHLIAGCFATLANAEKHMLELRRMGYEPYIVDHHKGLYRVSVQSHHSHEAALDALREVRGKAKTKDAWLLKSKH